MQMSCEDVTVSRISAPRLRPNELIAKPIPRRTGRDVMYKPTPIERTLRQRQLLQPSKSTLHNKGTINVGPLFSRSASLPRITLSSSMPFSDHSCSASSLPLSQGSADASRGSGFRDRSRSAGFEASSPRRDGPHCKDVEKEPWLGILSGGHRVAIPFSQFDDFNLTAAKDTDRLVHWYRSKQDEMLYTEAVRKQENTEVEQPLLPWARELDEARKQLAIMEPSTGQALVLETNVSLLDHLDSIGPRRGPEALVEAILFKTDANTEVTELLGCLDDGYMGLMIFTGAAAVLGLDVPALCGVDEQELCLRLDSEKLGLVRVEGFMSHAMPRGRRKRTLFVPAGVSGDSCPEKPPKQVPWNQTRHLLENIPSEVRGARQKWMAVARWMGNVAHRGVALGLERRNRGWHVQGKVGTTDTEEAKSLGEPHETDGQQCSNENSPEVSDSKTAASRVLLEAAVLMRQQERSVKDLFRRSASVQLANLPPMMDRADLHNFFADLVLVDRARHVRATPQVLDRLYDEAVALQCSYTKLGTGLSFWSFKAVLNNAIHELGLGPAWRQLSELVLNV